MINVNKTVLAFKKNVQKFDTKNTDSCNLYLRYKLI